MHVFLGVGCCCCCHPALQEVSQKHPVDTPVASYRKLIFSPLIEGDHPSKTAHPSLVVVIVTVKTESDIVYSIGMLYLEHEPNNRKHKRDIKMERKLVKHHLNWRKLKEIYWKQIKCRIEHEP